MNEIEVFIDVPVLGGNGVPGGGTTGQVLTKRSDQEGDYGWENPAEPEGVEKTSNKVQEIGEGSATKYPSTQAVKTFVDTGLSGKASKSTVEELAQEVANKIGEAPKDGLIYGRCNGDWTKVALVSGLLVTINHPEGVYDSDYTVVVRAAGAEERYTYTGAGMAISAPAGVLVRVSVIAPANFTAPRPFIYDSVLGITRTYECTSIAIVDGYYVLTDDGNYVPFDQWTSAYNEHAIGLGYYSSEVAFAVAKVFGRLDNPLGGSIDKTIHFGSAYFDCSSIGMMQAVDVASARQLPLCGEINNRAMVESHILLQRNWRNETIVNSTEQGYFPLAMVAHKFKTVLDDDFGNWRLPDIKEADVIFNMKNKFKTIGSVIFNDWGSDSQLMTCVPIPNIQFFGYSRQGLMASDAGQVRRKNFSIGLDEKTSVFPVRNF